MQQQEQVQGEPAEPVSTVSTSPALIVVLDDEMMNHVVGGVSDGPAGTW